MPRYLVNSAILESGQNSKACAEGAAKMLSRGKIKDIEAKACYCCKGENRVAFLIDGPSQDAVLETVQEQLNIPVASIMEAEEVKQPQEAS
jgi:hypothetical protein